MIYCLRNNNNNCQPYFEDSRLRNLSTMTLVIALLKFVLSLICNALKVKVLYGKTNLN